MTVRTAPFLPAPGSAVDPMVAEVTWQAWELTAADPAQLSSETAQHVNGGFDLLVEAAWRPGRSILVSEVEWTPEIDSTGELGRLAVRLAVGILGEKGTTAFEAAGMTPGVESTLERARVFGSRRVDPAVVVAASDPLAGVKRRGYAAHLSQGSWTISDGEDLVGIVSRYSPTVEPWSAVVDHLERTGQHVRVRATVLASRLSPADRIEIESALSRVGLLRDRNAERPEMLFDADRAEATLLDLRASFASPVVAAELVVWSDTELPDTMMRSIAASFTSEIDVLRRQGHVVVASNRLVLGGFTIERNPQGWAEAIHQGVPNRGGLGPHGLRDLLTLAESPIGWPLPVRGPLPSLSTRVSARRPVPDLLRPQPGREEVVLGTAGLDGPPIAAPLELRTRHLVATGTWGSGKSSLLFAQALDDMRSGRPFLFLDPHGAAADELIAHARHLGRDPVVVDADDGGSDRIRILPERGDHSHSLGSADQAIRRVADAVASSLLNAEWAGPRWFAAFEALLELIVIHEAELLDAVVWLNDLSELRARVRHPDLSSLSRSTLQNLALSTGDGADVRGWVSSKLHPVVSSSVRRIIAPVGDGVDLAGAVADRRPVIVSLASLSMAEGNLVGHLALASILDAAFVRPPRSRTLVTCYVDEAHRFPANGLSRAMAEGRKFHVALQLAVQSLGQLPRELTDLALGVGTQVAFRATPDTAARLAPLLEVDAQELVGQPDLHATIRVQSHPATSMVVSPPERCPVPRVVDLPAEAPGSTAAEAPGSTAAEPPGRETEEEERALLDVFLARHRMAKDFDAHDGHHADATD